MPEPERPLDSAGFAKAAYEAKFGPITKTSAAAGSSYRWLQDPWPWNFGQNEVK